MSDSSSMMARTDSGLASDSIADGTYAATAGDVRGEGRASTSGNSMFLDYVLTIELEDGSIDVAVDDRMYLVSENVLINESSLTKFGLPVGGILLLSFGIQRYRLSVQSLISQLLGYAGLIPFFGFCLGFSSLEDWPRSLSIQGFVIYSLAIFAFLAGALWGQVQAVQAADGESAVSTLIVSNGLVLFGVAAILTAQAMMAAFFSCWDTSPCSGTRPAYRRWRRGID